MNPDVAFEENNDTPVGFHFSTDWLSKDKDKANESAGWMLRMAADWAILGAPPGIPQIEKAAMSEDFKLHNVTRTVV